MMNKLVLVLRTAVHSGSMGCTYVFIQLERMTKHVHSLWIVKILFSIIIYNNDNGYHCDQWTRVAIVMTTLGKANRHSLLSLSTSSAAALCLCGYWYGFIWKTQQIMDDFLQDNKLIDMIKTHQLPSPLDPKKYIVFTPVTGQGLGNQLNGLLAAHLLGDEFGRIVCVGRWEWDAFFDAMEYVNPQAQATCKDLPPMMTNSSSDEKITLLNFGNSPNECQLREKLASDHRVIYFTGNTYPRWCTVPPNYWFRQYRPTQRLLEILPWKDPPHTVVHLRHGDNIADPRLGLDHNTLVELGESLPSDTFLVTNWVEWFDFFETKYGWRNSNWMTVQHSALTHLKWVSREIALFTRK
jgi:hypothetical protein